MLSVVKKKGYTMANRMTLDDLPPTTRPTRRVEIVGPDNSKSEHNQTARLPPGYRDTGVGYAAGEKKRGVGPAFHKTGENANAEDVGMLLTEDEPAEKLHITAESGKALAELVQPHI